VKTLPIVKQPTSVITIPQRTAKVVCGYDVLVVGGGPSGLGAALGAADAGAKVALVEQYGFLGGHATAALLGTFAAYHTFSSTNKEIDETGLFPSDHGLGKPVVKGVLSKIIERLVQIGGAITPTIKTGYTVPFDSEAFKQVALEKVEDAGIEVLFHAFASSVIDCGNTKKVLFETKSGPVAIEAKVIVDCTGDGDIAAYAGAPYEIGRKEDRLTQPMTLLFLLKCFQPDQFREYVKQNPNQWNGVQGLEALIRQATAKGKLNLPRENILFFGTTRKDQLSINSTRVTKVLGTNVWDLTYAEIESRKQMVQIANFLREYVPGFEKTYIAQSGATIGVRETRRIIGEYVLTADDILNAKKFPDTIAHATYPIDIHNPKGKGTIIKKVPLNEYYDIPLRCLIPLKVENLLVAGRCISGTSEAQAAYRVMPTCVATGQAAGVCAALASLKNQYPRLLPADQIQKELTKQGAQIWPKDFSS
jgi:2-polyprenyl-6-methoxyphenol hydroxylase-like FAD-dependent oxidoreductase